MIVCFIYIHYANTDFTDKLLIKPANVPGTNVDGAGGNVIVNGTIKLTVVKGDPNELAIETSDVTVNGGSDGKITGLDEGTVYEYRLTDDPNAPYESAPADANGEIAQLPAGEYEIRVKETDDYEAGSLETVTINEPGQIILTVNKDGDGYNGKTLTLKEKGTDNIVDTVTVIDGEAIFNVPLGEYDIYDGGNTPIGSIELSDTDDAEMTLNYYTVTYSVEYAGTADDDSSSITATYGDDEIASGDVVLGGKDLVITVTDASGANSYTYGWSDSSTETSNVRSITNVDETVDVTCTITGVDYLIEVTANGLDNLQVGVPVTEADNAKIIFTLDDSKYAATLTDADFTSAIDNLPAGLSIGTVTRKDDNTVEVAIIGTPTTATTEPIILRIPETIPGMNVDGAGGNVLVTGNISLTVIKGDSDNLSIGTNDVTTNGGSDGAITGLDEGTVYEYRLTGDPNAPYISRTADENGEITELPAGEYEIRIKETDDYEAGSLETVTINEPGQVILTVNKDGDDYNGKTFTLKKQGTAETVDTVTVTDGEAIFNVPLGEYDIYDGGNIPIGRVELSSADDAEKILNYYTVTYSVQNAGDATDATITATYGDDEIASGDVVLSGKELVITVTDASGANAYTYGWYDNIEDEDCNSNNKTLTIDELLGKAEVTCTVTGVSYGITVTAEGLDNLKADVPVTGAQIIFTLNGGEYDDDEIIDLEQFTVGNLPEGLIAGTPVRIDDNTVIVPITGKPKQATATPIILDIPASIPGENNVVGAIGDITVTGTVSLTVYEAGKYNVSGQVINEDESGLGGAKVTIKREGKPLDGYEPVYTDSEGYFTLYNIPVGTYNLVIEYNDNGMITTVTQILKVPNDLPIGQIKMPIGGKTTIFDHELENEVKVNAVEHLDKVYGNVNGNTTDEHGVTEADLALVEDPVRPGYVEVVLVAKDVDHGNPVHATQSADVQRTIQRDNMIFTHEFDLSAFKYVHEDAQNIDRSTASETSLKRINNLVQIYIPIPDSLLDKTDSIAVYRHHDGQVERIPKATEDEPTVECFKIVDGATLVLYVEQFSVYALAVTAPSSPYYPTYPTYPTYPSNPYYPQYPADNSGSNNSYPISVGFDANGGHGGKSYDTTYGGSYLLPNNTFTRDGYTFAGWKINNSGQTIAPGRSVGVDGSITIYAQWTLINSVITAPADNGKASANSAEPKTGEKVTVTIEPDAGFELDTLTITDMDGNEIAYKNNGDGTYTYTHPDGKATVNATFKRLPAVDGSDVSSTLITEDHMAYVQGRGEDMFFPDANMTRAEAAQMFCNLLRDKDAAVTVNFPDVPDSLWYAKAINTLASMGIIEGFPDGNFYPDEHITRAQFAAIVVRFANVATASVPFKDVPETHWAYDYISTASHYGWLNWITDDNFLPENNIARAEAVAIVNRMLRRYPDKDYINSNQELIRYSDTPETHWAFYEIMEASYAHEYVRKTDNSEIWREILWKFSIIH